MALLYKQLSPLHGVWKWKKALMSFWGCLSIKRTILLFGAGIGREAEAGTFRQPDAFKRAFRRGGKG